MSNTTETRTVREAAEAEARDLVLNSQEEVIAILASSIEHALYLSMKAERDMQDNFDATEGVVALMPLPDLTDDEVVEAAAYFDLDADYLDDPWAEAHDRAMEAGEGDEDACAAATDHLPGQAHRWQECPVYHDEEN